MKRPHCPRCNGILEHNRASQRVPEHVMCKGCGWLLEREHVPVMAFRPIVSSEPKKEKKQISERRLKAMLAVEKVNQWDAERTAAIAAKRRSNRCQA